MVFMLVRVDHLLLVKIIIRVLKTLNLNILKFLFYILDKDIWNYKFIGPNLLKLELLKLLLKKEKDAQKVKSLNIKI